MKPQALTLSSAGLQVAALHWPAPGRPRVLAVHGWLDNAASFIPMASAMAGQLDLVAIDLPGHGHSDHRGAAASYPMVDWIEVVEHCADALEWTQFALLGHSLGGAVCSFYAAARPDRVNRLALIEALGPLSAPAEKSLELLRKGIEGRFSVQTKRLRLFADIAEAARARESANDLSPEAARLIAERGLRAADGGYTWRSDPRLTTVTPHRFTEPQVLSILSGIGCPVRLVLADPPSDVIGMVAMQGRLAAVPQTEVLRIPGHHHVHMESPAELAAAFGDWLASEG